jgi:sugar lactone lactonase YvrE
VAGTGQQGFSGDGGPATDATLSRPHSIALDNDGRLYICDIGNHRIRVVDLETGRIDTFAGTGQRQSTPDGAGIDGTPLHGPRALDFDGNHSLYLALREGNAVYRIDLETRTLHHLAGTGEKGWTGDGGPARAARLSGPKGLALSGRNLYVADTESHTIRRVNLDTGIITTVLGAGVRGDGPETDPLQCKLARPHGLFAAPDGTLYVTDSEAHRIRVLKP